MNGKLLSLIGKAALRAQRASERTGRLGRLLSDGTWQYYPEDRDRPGFVIVRLENGTSSSFIEALNMGVAIIGDLPVKLRINEQGIYEAYPNGLESQQYLGTGADAVGMVAPHSHAIESGNADPVSGRRFLPGLIHVTYPPSLSIEIEPFAYQYNGLNKVNARSTFDLTGNLPVTTGAWAWAIVGFNPATEAVEAETGADYFTFDTLLESQIQDIAFEGRIVLGAVKLYEADTAISEEKRFAFKPDIRHFLQVPASAPGLDKAVVGSDGNIVTMNGEVVWLV